MGASRHSEFWQENGSRHFWFWWENANHHTGFFDGKIFATISGFGGKMLPTAPGFGGKIFPTILDFGGKMRFDHVKDTKKKFKRGKKAAEEETMGTRRNRKDQSKDVDSFNRLTLVTLTTPAGD